MIEWCKTIFALQQIDGNISSRKEKKKRNEMKYKISHVALTFASAVFN